MKATINFLVAGILVFSGCAPADRSDKSEKVGNASNDGVRLIEISTTVGEFNVWTRRVGENPDIKVLLLHGGPGATHELYEIMDEYFPQVGFEYYYYDQLGSYNSDQPDDPSLWVTERFVEEVEQVRQALGLTSDNFYLLGQSWGGILAMEYALRYQKNLKGLIISNMMSSAPLYARYAEEVLGPQLDPDVLAEIQAFEAAEDYSNPRYSELLMQHYYTEHILRMPLEEWPDAINRTFEHLNPDVYVTMQGPSEFGISGVLETWDVSNRLPEISVATLVIGSEHDTMDPEHMEWMSTQVQSGRYLYCPDGSHLSQYDDSEVYFGGVIAFIQDVHNGTF